MKINFENIKNFIIGLVFAGMGIWCISIDLPDNLKLAFGPSITAATVSEIESSRDFGRAYRVKGSFDFSYYYEMKNISDTEGGYSEDVTAYLYLFRDSSSNCDLLIKSASPPESMEVFCKDRREILVTLREFNSEESFNLFISGSRDNDGHAMPGSDISSLVKNIKENKNTGLQQERILTTSFYGEMSSGSDNVKWRARGELIKSFLLGGFLLLIGIAVLLVVFNNEE